MLIVFMLHFLTKYLMCSLVNINKHISSKIFNLNRQAVLETDHPLTNNINANNSCFNYSKIKKNI